MPFLSQAALVHTHTSCAYQQLAHPDLQLPSPDTEDELVTHGKLDAQMYRKMPLPCAKPRDVTEMYALLCNGKSLRHSKTFSAAKSA